MRTGVVFTAGLVVGWLPAHWHLQAHWSARELPHWSTDATVDATATKPTQVAAGAVTVIGPRNNAAVVAAPAMLRHLAALALLGTAAGARPNIMMILVVR